MVALQRRAELANAVAAGKEPAEVALARLRTLALPAESQGDTETDFTHAAIDVGQRLHAGGKREDAGHFFRAAEDALTSVLDRTADDSGVAKADALVAARVQLLANRAFIRAQFLQKIPEAIADLDAAQKLAPDDRYLQDLRRVLLNDKAAWLAGQPQN